MLRVCIIVLIAVFFAVLLTECDKVKMTPEPEVEIIWFDPLGAYVFTGQSTVEIKEIHFKVWNYVDSRITKMEYKYLSVLTNDIITPTYTIGLDVLLPGGDDT